MVRKYIYVRTEAPLMIALLLIFSGAAHAGTRLARIDDTRYALLHSALVQNSVEMRKNAAVKMASVCVALGYEHAEITESDHDTGSRHAGAIVPNKNRYTVEFRLLDDPTDDSLDCEKLAEDKHVRWAEKWMRKRGVKPRDPAQEAEGGGDEQP